MEWDSLSNDHTGTMSTVFTQCNIFQILFLLFNKNDYFMVTDISILTCMQKKHEN
jgi:hypothetical protein